MPYETFDLRFENCEHAPKIPLLHKCRRQPVFHLPPGAKGSSPAWEVPEVHERARN
jgi:hypothetical protein